MGLIDDEDALDTGDLTLLVSDHPELTGIKTGAEVKGTYTARVKSVADGQVVLQFDSHEIETENFADKELRNMRSNVIEADGADESDDDLEDD